MTSEADRLSGRYSLESRIASGGMATVWRACDEVLARTVAVKLLHPHLARDGGFLERFRVEALAAARLTHPNIVAIYDSGRDAHGDDDRHFIVMEYCARGTLATTLADSGVLAPPDVVHIASRICDALACAHERGVVHRDIKPANVLVCEDGALKVADFGIAKAAFAKSDLTTTGAILGTVTYLAPEQTLGLEPDARSDIYSLGVVLYELVAGRPPFEGEGPLAVALKHQRESPRPLRSMRAGVPRPLDDAILRALEKDPADRYASVDEMRAALERTGSRAGATAVLRVPPRVTRDGGAEAAGPRRAPRPRHLVAAAVALAAVLALALGVPRLVALLDGGGVPGGAGGTDAGERAMAPLVVASVGDFDPHAGDGEHPEDAPLAVDGDPSTAWRTSTYDGPIQQTKPGVGLLFDLGDAAAVRRVRLVTDTPGLAFELRAGDEVPRTESELDVVARRGSAATTNVIDVGEISARYWLVWITALPGGGGGNARVAEVAFRGD